MGGVVLCKVPVLTALNVVPRSRYDEALLIRAEANAISCETI